MTRSTKVFTGAPSLASDGGIERADHLYLHDQQAITRDFASAMPVGKANWTATTPAPSDTMDQVGKSPNLDTHPTVSRRYSDVHLDRKDVAYTREGGHA